MDNDWLLTIDLTGLARELNPEGVLPTLEEALLEHRIDLERGGVEVQKVLTRWTGDIDISILQRRYGVQPIEKLLLIQLSALWIVGLRKLLRAQIQAEPGERLIGIFFRVRLDQDRFAYQFEIARVRLPANGRAAHSLPKG